MIWFFRVIVVCQAILVGWAIALFVRRPDWGGLFLLGVDAVFVLANIWMWRQVGKRRKPLFAVTADTSDEEIKVQVDQLCRMIFETRTQFPYTRQEMFTLFTLQRDKLRKERDV